MQLPTLIEPNPLPPLTPPETLARRERSGEEAYRWWRSGVVGGCDCRCVLMMPSVKPPTATTSAATSTTCIKPSGCRSCRPITVLSVAVSFGDSSWQRRNRKGKRVAKSRKLKGHQALGQHCCGQQSCSGTTKIRRALINRRVQSTMKA
ncbi:hypothetical protein E3N88_38188 [Mikania micrantha]|uniref:Uncharacterized protein n=1 Tax=Mikania micrantha TaxID=192012 RepID=A0A5N6LTA4_9ASTR|nr:hypothetical protein E3N88_38188 [Mikania micrantha]